jgi:solute carrier family 25 (mitochondrial aspartate/glutamate transporter), member 12/13
MAISASPSVLSCNLSPNETRTVGVRFLDREQFVNAIAPKGDLTRIGRSQYATLFRVADVMKRGLLSWDDFMVFQTLLKRPDADYYIAFQYFDVYACPLFSAHDSGDS